MSVKPLLTAEQLWEMESVPGKRFELVKGELIEMPGAGGVHGLLVMVFVRLLDPFVLAGRLGAVFADGVSYVLDRAPDVVRIPDVSFIAFARLPEGKIPEGYIDGAPDLAVEVVSPSDRADDVYGKVRGYLEAGTRLVWVVWPRYRAITVYTEDGQTRELRANDELTGDDVLPGFSVRVDEIFAAI